ncbi:hypothetical protein [Nocardia sp. IFM 10818]
MRGCLAGAVMAALAVAAHGWAGGGYPGSAGLTLLLLAAAAVGALVALLPVRHSPAAVPALMALGQPAGHVALSGLAHGGHGSGAADFVVDGAMTVAHAIAAIAFAFLILIAERLYTVVSQALRVVSTRPAAGPVRAGSARWAHAAPVLRGRLVRGGFGPRAPPVAV